MCYGLCLGTIKKELPLSEKWWIRKVFCPKERPIISCSNVVPYAHMHMHVLNYLEEKKKYALSSTLYVRTLLVLCDSQMMNE